MSWNPFASETVTTVGTSVSRVISDEMLPSSIKTGTVKNLYFHTDQMVESVMEELSQGLGIRAERMYRYGRDHYLYGLPSSTFVKDTTGQHITERVIEEMEGQNVTTEYYHYGAFNAVHYGWQALVNIYAYDQESNEIKGLSIQKGAPVYLTDMVPVYTQATLDSLEGEALAQWGTSPKAGYTPLRPYSNGSLTLDYSPFLVDTTASEDKIQVKYCWKSGNTIYEDTLFITVVKNDAGVTNPGYFQVKYFYTYTTSTPSQWIGGDPIITTHKAYRYFTYREGSGDYPDLDTLFETSHSNLGTYFPWTYFRFDKTSELADKTSASYQSGKKLLNTIGVDFDQVAESIDANPDIGDIEQALMMMAVPANTQNPLEQRYLFDYFSRLYLETDDTVIGTFPGLGDINAIFQRTPTPKLSFIIQDQRFQMALSMLGLTKVRKAGKIGPVGSYTSEAASRTTQYTGKDAVTASATVWTANFPVHYFRRQITPGVYEEIEIVGLEMRYYIEGYSTVSSDGVNSLLIPLDYSITEHYSTVDRETLYARSLYFVINSMIETKLKWYQQEWFQVVIIIVAIVITVMSVGSDGGSSLSAALALGAYTYAATVILAAVVKMYLESVILKWIVKQVGAEAAAIIAVVALIYGAYEGYSAGGLQNAPWAQALVQVGNGLVKAASNQIEEALLGLRDEAEAFGLETEKKMELLEETNKLLQGHNLLSPFILWGEAPGQYYQRTVHSGNIGTIAIDAISSYVENSLKLPETFTTLGETVYGFPN